MPGMLATLSFDGGRLAAVALCDLAFSAHVGAALAQLPVDDVQPSISAGCLSEDLPELFHEVVNVVSKLLNSSSTPHVVLCRLLPLPGRCRAGRPGALGPPGRAPALRRHHRVGYGSGRMTLLAW